MDCEHWISLISERLDRVLRPEDEAALAAHLSECDECRAFAGLMQTAHLEMERMAEEPPADLAACVMQAVAAEKRPVPMKKVGAKRWARYGALAAVLTVVVLAAWAIPRVSGQGSIAAEADTVSGKSVNRSEEMLRMEPAAAGAAPAAGAPVMTADNSAAEETEVFREKGEAMPEPETDTVQAPMLPAEDCRGEAAAPETVEEGVAISGGNAVGIPALPYFETYSAVLVCADGLPEELQEYPAERGAETEIYVFVPTEEARHMIESGAYTVFLEGDNISPEAETAIVVVYGA